MQLCFCAKVLVGEGVYRKMLAKLALLLKGKALAAALGVLLVSGGGAAVAVAAKTQTGPFTPAAASSTSTQNGNHGSQANGNHAHTVAVDGVLMTYDATAQTIGVQKNGETSTTTISVDDKTLVNGDQATSLADLTHSLKHRVQVQADKQSDDSLLAWKVTVGGVANPNGGNGGNGGSNGSNGSNGNVGQRPVVGTVVSVDITASSFVLKASDGTTVTVTVSTTTTFQGSVHSLADLKDNAHVTVRGASQTDGTIAATSVEIGDAPGA
jgi:hypothetical protein